MLTCVIATANPSVRLSVRPTVTCWYCTKWKEDRIMRFFFTARQQKHCSYLIPTMVGDDIQFPLKFAVQVTHTFEKGRLRPTSAYNVSTVRASEKNSISRIGSQPRAQAYHRAIDKVRTLPLTPQVGSKSEFVIFVNKNQFKQNKLCYKVSLCQNFKRQSCSRTIPLYNGVQYFRSAVRASENVQYYNCLLYTSPSPRDQA